MEVINTEKHRLFKQAWEKHETDIRRLCKYKLNSNQDAIEDVIADVFLYLWIEIDNNGVPQNLHGWLYKVAVNLINQKYREFYNGKNKILSYDDGIAKSYLLTGYDIDDLRLESETLFMWADEIIDELPEKDRTLFKMIYDEDLPMKEIAERLGTTATAIKQRHYRLVRKVKKAVRERIENS